MKFKKNTTKQKSIKLNVSQTHKPDDISLEEWQRTLRKQYSEQQNYKLENIGSQNIFSEFLLTNPASGKTYKIAIRGNTPGDNYCSCPDYSINTLGTCKHIEYTLSYLAKKKGVRKAFREGYVTPYSEIYLSYGLKHEVKFKQGKEAPSELISLVNEYFDSRGILKEIRILDFHTFLTDISHIKGHEVRCYDDVMTFIAEHQDIERRRRIINNHLKEGIHSPILKTILKTDLYPYQREGAVFAVKAWRCLLGDDMGLGKTIQALTAAELMARIFNIQKVLIVSPTSLKHQWYGEIKNLLTGRFRSLKVSTTRGNLFIKTIHSTRLSITSWFSET